MSKDQSLYLLKVGELVLKGENQCSFEKVLRRNIRTRLSGFHPVIVTQQGRMFLRLTGCPAETAEQVLSRTPGISGFAEAVSVRKSIDAVTSAVLAAVDTRCRQEEGLRASGAFSFKVNARRSDKSFPLTSYELCCRLGEAVLDRFPKTRVSMKAPDISITVEIRNNAYIYLSHRSSPGGLPVGTAGRGLLMLSGGIDSPVAGYLMAVRGMAQDALYFHTYPYTGDEVLEKVQRLTEILRTYMPGLRLFVVPFTEIQLAVNRCAVPAQITLMMRFAMVRIAGMIAAGVHAQALITGESLSQVASQTVESLSFTNMGTDLLILRPLIGLDKEEIIRTARSIGTYETSILPYADCCTIFAPEHPLVKPDSTEMLQNFARLNLEQLITAAAEAGLRSQAAADDRTEA